jgi:tetratricopeptide (TPR) repeat protein
LPLTRISLQLLQQLFADYPVDSELESAHMQAAQCQERLGNLQEATRHFRLAVEAHSNRPNVHSGVALEFPWFIVEHRLTACFDEALTVLDSAVTPFPVQVFKAATIRSRIAQFRGDTARAANAAREALEAADATQSRFRYHRALGLVGEEYKYVVSELQQIAAT